MTVTMKDIAEKAGVAKSTISKVLNGKSYGVKVGEETRRKVLEVARELNYRPNFNAQTLTTKRCLRIGLYEKSAFRNLRDHYLSEIMSGIGHRLRGTGYDLMLLSDDKSVTDSIDMVRSQRLDGMIYVVTARIMDDFMQECGDEFNKMDVPMAAIIGSERTDVPFNSIVYRSRQAGYLAGQHLVACGHTRLAFVTGEMMHLEPVRDYYEGCCEAVREAGLDPAQILVVEGKVDDVAENLIPALVKKGNAPTGFCCQSDFYAMAVIKGLEACGLQVPVDCGVVGSKDLATTFAQHSALVRRDLTTVAEDVHAKGAMAADIVFKMLDTPEENRVHIHEVLEPELIVRATTIPRTA